MNQCANVGDDFTCKDMLLAATALAMRCMTACVAVSVIVNHSGIFRAIGNRVDMPFGNGNSALDEDPEQGRLRSIGPT